MIGSEADPARVPEATPGPQAWTLGKWKRELCPSSTQDTTALLPVPQKSVPRLTENGRNQMKMPGDGTENISLWEESILMGFALTKKYEKWSLTKSHFRACNIELFIVTALLANLYCQ